MVGIPGRPQYKKTFTVRAFLVLVFLNMSTGNLHAVLAALVLLIVRLG
jgi:hypothetical protein